LNLPSLKNQKKKGTPACTFLDQPMGKFAEGREGSGWCGHNQKKKRGKPEKSKVLYYSEAKPFDETVKRLFPLPGERHIQGKKKGGKKRGVLTCIRLKKNRLIGSHA